MVGAMAMNMFDAAMDVIVDSVSMSTSTIVWCVVEGECSACVGCRIGRYLM